MEYLYSEGAVSESQFDVAKTEYEVAKADFEAASKLVELRTPIGGTITSINVSVGDYVYTGQQVATVAMIDNLRMKLGVSANDVEFFNTGDRVAVHIGSSDMMASGEVVTMAGSADPDTRTFRVELEVPNPDMNLELGITAGVSLPLPEITAHKLTAGVFTLNDDGQLGVMTVDVSGIVRFNKVTVLDSDADWAYVTGLPERALLISVGQEFVSDGETVRAVPESAVGTDAAKAS